MTATTEREERMAKKAREILDEALATGCQTCGSAYESPDEPPCGTCWTVERAVNDKLRELVEELRAEVERLTDALGCSARGTPERVTEPTLTITPHGNRLWTVIGDPPGDGREWEDQCARCGSSVSWEHCEWCDGERGDWEVDYSDPSGEDEWVTWPRFSG